MAEHGRFRANRTWVQPPERAKSHVRKRPTLRWRMARLSCILLRDTQKKSLRDERREEKMLARKETDDNTKAREGHNFKSRRKITFHPAQRQVFRLTPGGDVLSRACTISGLRLPRKPLVFSAMTCVPIV